MKQINWVYTGIIAAWLVCVGEFFVDRWLGSRFPGYDWTRQSISYLGQEGSPVTTEVAIWGVLFSLFFVLFAIGFYNAFRSSKLGRSNNKWIFLASLMIAVYGLGEGMGSGFFPINPAGTPYSASALMHDTLSGIGDAGLVLLPFVMLRIFQKEENPRFFYFSCATIVLGLILASFFLAAKFFKPDSGLLIYKGISQRLYLANYNIYLIAITWMMWKAVRFRIYEK